jgi:hypothetical protein
MTFNPLRLQERAGLRQPRRAPRVVTLNAPRGGDLISLASRRESLYDPLAAVPLVNVPLNSASSSVSGPCSRRISALNWGGLQRSVHIRDDRERV